MSEPAAASEAQAGAQPRLTLAACAALLALLTLCGCGQQADQAATKPAEAQAIVKEAAKGPVTLRVSCSPPQPRLSDMLELALEVRAAPEVDVEPPAFGEAVGDFLVRDYHEANPRMEEGKTVRRFIYQLEPVHAGKHLIRALSVVFTDRRADSEAKDKAVTLETEPLEVEVTSEFAEGAPDLARLAPMDAPVPLPGGWVWLAWTAGAAGLVLAAGGVWYARRRHGPAAAAEPVRTPEEIAHAELAALLADRLPERGLFAEFYVRLTGIVRRYIERKTGIHAPEQTTEEFLHEIKHDPRFVAERATALGRFLEKCDLVKYAAQRPDPMDIEHAFGRAQEFVGLAGGVLQGSPRETEKAEAVG